jgi:hypothetical protein
MDGGLVHATEEGTPQGSPLSPLFSNVMLDDLDWELEKRGHRFVTTRNWGVSMERRVKEINRFTVGWTAYSRSPTPSCRPRSSTRGRAAGSDSCAGSGGSAHKRATGTYARSGSSSGTLAVGRPRRRGTGASPGPGHSREPAQRLLAHDHRPDGIRRPVPSFPGMLSEPPGADPHAGWCGGPGRAWPLPDSMRRREATPDQPALGRAVRGYLPPPL